MAYDLMARDGVRSDNRRSVFLRGDQRRALRSTARQAIGARIDGRRCAFLRSSGDRRRAVA